MSIKLFNQIREVENKLIEQDKRIAILEDKIAALQARPKIGRPKKEDERARA